MGRIVVGVDGSDGSVAALRWARDEARLRDAELVLVHAYTDPPLAMYPTVVMPVVAPEELETAGARIVADTLEAAGGSGGVPVHVEIEVGGPAGVLVAHSAGAEMVVTGTRGHGGFRELLLGSVSHQVATHAACPTVIVGVH